MLSSPLRRLLAAFVITLSMFSVAATAQAADEVFADGFIPSTGYTAPNRHSLTAVDGRQLNYSQTEMICVNAVDDDTGNFSGTEFACVATYNATTSKPFCGCKLRKGFVWPETLSGQVRQTSGTGRARQYY